MPVSPEVLIQRVWASSEEGQGFPGVPQSSQAETTAPGDPPALLPSPLPCLRLSCWDAESEEAFGAARGPRLLSHRAAPIFQENAQARPSLQPGCFLVPGRLGPHPPAPALLLQHLNPADRDSQTQRAYGFYEGVTHPHPSMGGCVRWLGPAGPAGGGVVLAS